MTPFAVPIVWCILQVTLLCMLGGVFYLVIRKAEPRLAVSSIALLLGLVAVLSLAALSPWPRWQINAMNAPADATDGEAATTPSPLLAEAGSRTDALSTPAKQPTFMTAAFWTAMWEELNHLRPRGEVDSPADSAGVLTPWSTYMLLLLSIAAGLGGIRLAAACHALRRLRLRSLPVADERLAWLLRGFERSFVVSRPVEVREASQLHSAATIGCRRPIILLPGQWRAWPQDELRAVVAHEMAHIAARDWPTWLIAQCVVALHFYHPLVHWLAHRLRLEQELAADAAAAAVTGSKESYLGNLAAQMLRADQIRPLWATQTFLPTRSTIVRRIEMLKSKSPQATTGQPPGRARFAIVTALLAVGVVVAGIRVPPAEITATAVAQQASGDRPGQVDGPEVERPGPADADANVYARYAEPNALFFAYTRPREIFASDEMAPLRAQFNQMIDESRGPFPNLKLEDLEAFAVSPSLTADRHEAVRFVLTFARPVADAQLQSARTEFKAVEQIGKGTLYSSAEPSGLAALKLGDHTLVLDSSLEKLKMLAMRLAADGEALWPWLEGATPRTSDQHVWVALNMEAVRGEFARETRGRQGPLPRPVPLTVVAPLVEIPQQTYVTGAFTPDLELTAVAKCDSEEDARQVAQTAQAFLTLARNVIAEQRQATLPEGAPQAMIAGTLEMADRFLQQAKVETAGNEARLTVAAGSTSQQLIQMGLILPAIQAARHAAQRTQSMNNLKQLALAMHNYHGAHGHFPPAVLTGPDGKTKYSWRVAILPFLEQAALYDEYRLTEPWDSEHNKRLLERMPDVFRSPTAPVNRFHSAYFVLVGDKTAFGVEGEGTPISEIPDGTSNTLLIVEAERPIEWTKPEDISYSADQPLPELGGHFPGIFLAAFADGSVHTLSQEIDQAQLRRLIEKSDGQPVQR